MTLLPIAARNRLLAWYQEAKRPLPWRDTRDPYAILVSEIMCQQTRVDVVIPYYRRWLERFPTAASLAEASEEEVLSLWQGLGYYRRARNLQAAAQVAVSQGSFPSDLTGLRQLPGVGAYTAGAIGSIAYDLPAAVVDGNVERVFARLSMNSQTGAALNRATWEWANAHIPKTSPGDWNQALMELGATVCTPRNPSCADCPLQTDCLASQHGVVSSFPVRPPKSAPKALVHEFVVPLDQGGEIGLVQIPLGEWWEGMWRFPFSHEVELTSEWIRSLPSFTHTVTTHRIRVHASMLRIEPMPNSLTAFSAKELANLPLPAPQRRIWRAALDLGALNL